jgi:signal peptidase I
VAVAIALVIRWAFMEAYVIPSASMLPTLLVHDHIFVNKIVFGLRVPFTQEWLIRFGDPKRGEVVIFKHPKEKHQTYVKRVVGLPGDRIFYENGNLYVNDQLTEKTVPASLVEDWEWVRDEDFVGETGQGGRENYAHWEETLGDKTYSILLRKGDKPSNSFGPYSVPPNHFFVIGDNRDNSQDSRGWDPDAERAHGEVTISRRSGTQALKVPLGTIVRTDQPGTWAQRYRTTKELTLLADPVVVPVVAAESGEMGNVAAETVTVVEGALVDSLIVTNPKPIQGGSDKRFIPRDLLVGRSMFVWLSCEKKLPVLSFLCHPFYIRWGRLLHRVR